MARFRRYRRYYRKGKYNIENRPLSFSGGTIQNSFYQNQVNIVPASTTEGVRQVARMTISLTATNSNADALPFFWAIVYIPEGATTSGLFPNSTTLFEPSNYVLASGVSDPNAGPIRISSRLRKNLNAGDQIYLYTASTQSAPTYTGLVRYAIKYN